MEYLWSKLRLGPVLASRAVWWAVEWDMGWSAFKGILNLFVLYYCIIILINKTINVYFFSPRWASVHSGKQTDIMKRDTTALHLCWRSWGLLTVESSLRKLVTPSFSASSMWCREPLQQGSTSHSTDSWRGRITSYKANDTAAMSKLII